MKINWNPDLYEIGIESIDKQHAELFKAINKLRDAYDRAIEKDIITETIDFLFNYLNLHFKDEESFMESISYPYLEDHKFEHEKFIDYCKNIRITFESEGTSKKFLIQIYNALFTWLIEHISRSDKQISSYIKVKS